MMPSLTCPIGDALSPGPVRSIAIVVFGSHYTGPLQWSTLNRSNGDIIGEQLGELCWKARRATRFEVYEHPNGL